MKLNTNAKNIRQHAKYKNVRLTLIKKEKNVQAYALPPCQQVFQHSCSEIGSARKRVLIHVNIIDTQVCKTVT